MNSSYLLVISLIKSRRQPKAAQGAPKGPQATKKGPQRTAKGPQRQGPGQIKMIPWQIIYWLFNYRETHQFTRKLENVVFSTNANMTGKHQVNVIFSQKLWNYATVSMVILPVALCSKHEIKQWFWHRTLAYQSCIKVTFLVNSQISQKYGQIVPTPCGSILHASRASHPPYNAKNRFLGISSNIPYYSYYPCKG